MQVGSTFSKMIRCLPNYQNSKSCSYRALPQTLITAQRKAGTKLTCWAELSCRKCNRSIAAFRQGRGAKARHSRAAPCSFEELWPGHSWELPCCRAPGWCWDRILTLPCSCASRAVGQSFSPGPWQTSSVLPKEMSWEWTLQAVCNGLLYRNPTNCPALITAAEMATNCSQRPKNNQRPCRAWDRAWADLRLETCCYRLLMLGITYQQEGNGSWVCWACQSGNSFFLEPRLQIPARLYGNKGYAAGLVGEGWGEKPLF